MKHTYHVEGMSCNGCRMHVEKELSAVSGVTGAVVDLEKEEVVIESEEHVPLETLRKALEEGGGGYRIMLPADKKKVR